MSNPYRARRRVVISKTGEATSSDSVFLPDWDVMLAEYVANMGLEQVETAGDPADEETPEEDPTSPETDRPDPETDDDGQVVPAGAKEVVEWIGDDPERAQAALVVEQGRPDRDQRVSVLAAIEGVLEAGG